MTRTESWEVADCMDSRSNNADSRIAKRRGFYVSLPVVFILVLLAVLIAVGVGLIVHFAGGKTNTNVICDACSAATTTSPTSKKVPSAAPTAAPITTIATPPTVLSYRLPTSVYPLHYDIELQPYIYDPDPQNFTFKGRVQILVRCNHPTKNITLHVEELNVDSSSIRITSATPSASGDPKYVSHEQETDRHFFIIKLDKNMQAGQNYSIQMNFSSPLWDGYFGMYYSKYKRNNQTVYLAVTQFEATNGRKAFPCFDEPAMKATFNITLVRREDYKSLSNMPIDNSDTKFQENGVNFVKDVYKQTPTMSTYILAFVVCDFLSIEKRTKNNVTIKTWAKPQSVNDTQYSLEDGVKITEYFEDYFDVKYPLEKQDMIAVPHFAGGAMENWGLIIYREQFMLNEDGVTTEEDKHKLAYTVAHELTHQWFGNLVTISWWSDIWLNEGFATYVGYMGLDHAHPSWRSFDLFIRLEKHVALSFDSQVTSHPVHVAVQTPEEIRNIFDNISYQKYFGSAHRHRPGNGSF